VIPFPSWTELIGGIVSERMLFPAFAACHSLQIHLRAHKSEGRANIADSARIATLVDGEKKKKKKEENERAAASSVARELCSQVEQN